LEEHDANFFLQKKKVLWAIIRILKGTFCEAYENLHNNNYS